MHVAAPGHALCRVRSFAALDVLHEYACALLSYVQDKRYAASAGMRRSGRELYRSRTLDRPRYGIWRNIRAKVPSLIVPV